MPGVVFRGNVILPDKVLPHGAVVAEGERIVVVGLERELKLPVGAMIVDSNDGYISPGFVDIHEHGGSGSDYMDGTPEAVRTANRTHARHGTTTVFPTSTTGTPAQLASMLDAVEDVARNWSINDGARIAGVHWYGPYFASDKIGAHPKGYERNPDPAEYRAALCAWHHQNGDVRGRTSRRGRVLSCGEGCWLPGHLRTLQCILARNGGGL